MSGAYSQRHHPQSPNPLDRRVLGIGTWMLTKYAYRSTSATLSPAAPTSALVCWQSSP
jgi:hypothetical protein